MENLYLNFANILIPKKEVDYSLYSVVACDQYTSEPEYWERVEKNVSDKPSAYNIIFPEVYLEREGFENKINSINEKMEEYFSLGVYDELKNSLIYVERTLKNGKVRKGIVGAVDLEMYDYQKGVKNYIRATEGTVLERIPPRVKIRQNALLETPHIMLLVDDEDKKVIEPLAQKTDDFELLYDFDLMENSGHIKGYKISDEQAKNICFILNDMSTEEYFNNKYSVEGQTPMLFAVGDGNHSLATAKACYENLKKTLPATEALNHPARYALIELVNLHDSSLEFEAIHRVVFGVNPAHLLDELNKRFDIKEGVTDGQTITYITENETKTITITNPNMVLAVGTLQSFLDEYMKTYGGKTDYIHGEDVVKKLSSKPDNIGFILPCMDKNDLFKTVILDGALPRKTFSMGEACDKRFYLEARKIK